MNLLYITDDYGGAHGTKAGLFDALRRAPRTQCLRRDFHHDHPQARFGGGGRMGEGRLFQEALTGPWTHILFASSGLSFEPRLMHRLGAAGKRLAGFGFSDPKHLDFTRGHWTCFDAYFSGSLQTVAIAREYGVNAHLMLPAVNRLDCFLLPEPKEWDVGLLGDVAGHPDAGLRRQAVSSLQGAGVSVRVISGLPYAKALKALRACRLGLCVMDDKSSMPRSVMEGASQYLCVLATPTPEAPEEPTPTP